MNKSTASSRQSFSFQFHKTRKEPHEAMGETISFIPPSQVPCCFEPEYQPAVSEIMTPTWHLQVTEGKTALWRGRVYFMARNLHNVFSLPSLSMFNLKWSWRYGKRNSRRKMLTARKILIFLKICVLTKLRWITPNINEVNSLALLNSFVTMDSLVNHICKL